MSNGLDPDQNRRSVGPDLGPNCLQRLSAENKSEETVKYISELISSWLIPVLIIGTAEQKYKGIHMYRRCKGSSIHIQEIKGNQMADSSNSLTSLEQTRPRSICHDKDLFYLYLT